MGTSAEVHRSVAGITLRALFERAINVYPDRVAVAAPDRTMTYRQLGERAGKTARVLVDLGLKRGDRIAVLAETSPEYVEIYVATASLGVVLVALNTRLHPDELHYCVTDSAPKIILVSARQAATGDALRQRCGDGVSWASFDDRDGYIPFGRLVAQASDTPSPNSVEPEDIHNVLYTSGTTGLPKGVMISQRAAATRGLRIAQWLGLTPDDGVLAWMPLFHVSGAEPLYATFTTGGCYAVLPTGDVEAMYSTIERHRITWTALVPGLLTDFFNHPERVNCDFSSLRLVFGYANLMPGIVQQITKELDIDFIDAYGQTESSFLVALGVSGPGEVPSLKKLPSPLMELRLVDDEMNDVPQGQPGECILRGPTVMSGYLNNPEATNEVFADGWLHTGDILRQNEDGSLTYTDRKKYLIKTGGENVYPAEVEAAIVAMDAVQEVVVVGVPDERWGEAVKAVVVPRQGATITAEEIITWCRGRLAGFKRPQYVEIRASDTISRSMTGKIRRDEFITGASKT
jgi:acyl-CoA synthetase (AMP-forming)/AMP-acid ligase II